ncbi:citrate lyase subunit beta/citryl-CoA lyase [Caldalkalibacillus uzonensis]|uniref:Citrate lyase subunit beta/citryl-CoA lyase n=1 Tax=Caldalkalibacillus uzonensis TaxID=353224 RepID=A0ABU0CWI2_9BACI|nr:CoA ester lyase [Caldalkalibacillus uzonensis]MDQ0340777.1 citrate lyase subunit beta/citryl-CoA lyase [Caldalkalibacillus uzonensis]
MNKHRAWLFVPGTNKRAMQKALTLDADVIIYDLEDAVEMGRKDVARQEVAEALQQQITSGQTRVVRINGATTPDYQQDLEAVAQAGCGGVMLPKTEDPAHIKQLDEYLNRVEKEKQLPPGHFKIVPQIETALGVHNSYDIARASKRVLHLAFGSVDYTADIQGEMTEEGWEVYYARAHLVNSSRAAGIRGPIDTVYIDIYNIEGLIRETERAKKMGFQGKLVIHPKQIGPVNAVYTPSEQEVTEARQIVEAFEQARSRGEAAIQLNGKMIDPPVVHKAMQVLKLYEQINKQT